MFANIHRHSVTSICEDNPLRNTPGVRESVVPEREKREKREERERKVGVQIWWEMSSYGNVFASAVHEEENEQEKRSTIEGLSFSLCVFFCHLLYHKWRNNITYCICLLFLRKLLNGNLENTLKINSVIFYFINIFNFKIYVYSKHILSAMIPT